MLNIVLPIAGRGSRFKEGGYSLPKPLIPVHGRPMIDLVVRNIRPKQPHRFVFLALQEHLETTDMRAVLHKSAPGCEIVPVNEVTQGAACTVLLARKFIDNSDAVMLANSDQYVDTDINTYLAHMEERNADGLIMTFWADHPKWSYAKLSADGWVTEVVEKKVVSNEATVGIYNFRHGSDFVAAADAMIAANKRVNGEFYVAPVYNELIASGAKVCCFNIGRELAGMYGLGIPADLESFLASEVSRRS